MRFVFLRLCSDPIVFLDRLPAWARLDWLTGDRVPDLSPEMRWIPVVTLFRLGPGMGGWARRATGMITSPATTFLPGPPHSPQADGPPRTKRD